MDGCLLPGRDVGPVHQTCGTGSSGHRRQRLARIEALRQPAVRHDRGARHDRQRGLGVEQQRRRRRAIVRQRHMNAPRVDDHHVGKVLARRRTRRMHEASGARRMEHTGPIVPLRQHAGHVLRSPDGRRCQPLDARAPKAGRACGQRGVPAALDRNGPARSAAGTRVPARIRGVQREPEGVHGRLRASAALPRTRASARSGPSGR